MGIIRIILALLWRLAICTAEERTEEWLSESHCTSVAEGDTGYIHFHFAELIDTDSHGLFLFVKRNEGPDILRCTQTPPAKAANCEVLDGRFETEGLVGMTLTLIILNATTDVQGLYVLRMMSPANHRIDCNFIISDKRGGKTTEHHTGQAVPIPVLVVALTTVAFLNVLLCLVVFIRRKNSAGVHDYTAKNTDAAASTIPRTEEEGDSLLDSPDSITNKHPREDNQDLYRPSSSTGQAESEPSTSAAGDDSDEVSNLKKNTDMEEMALRMEEREQLLQNGPGSFLIRRSKTNPTEYLLAGELLRIVLVGKTGAGKSSTGNTILGKKIFRVLQLSAKLTCEKGTTKRSDTEIEILDTTGLFDKHDTQKTQDKLSRNFLQAVASMHPGPHAFLYVVRTGRYTVEEYGAYRRLKALFDEHFTKYMIVLFTGGDELERDGKSITNLLNDDGVLTELEEVLRDCSNRYIVFNNMARDPHAQVEQLLSMIRAMVAQNGGNSYSCPKYDKIDHGMQKGEAGSLQNDEHEGTETMEDVVTQEGRTRYV